MLASLNFSLLVSLLCCILKTTTAQNVPPIPCPEYFQYISSGGSYYGKVTLPSSGGGTTNLELQLSQRGSVPPGNAGKLSPYYNQQQTISNVQNGLPLVYRVTFPFSNVLPKLTRITVNNQVICFGEGFPLPNAVIDLRHTLSVSRGAVGVGSPFITMETPNFSDIPFYTTTQRVIQQPLVETTYYTDGPVYQQPEVFYTPPRMQPSVSRQPTAERVQPPIRTPAIVIQQQQQQQPQQQQPQTHTQSVEAACGRRTSTFTPFAYKGTELTLGQIPWLTVVNEKLSDGVQFLCGGSLVSARTVITAAHCFQSRVTKDDVVLFIGRYNLSDYSEKLNIRTVSKLIINPDYNLQKISDSDVAIMHLNEPVTFDDLVSPICLWNESDDVSQIVGKKGYIAGWGADENGNAITKIPKMVNANIVDRRECEKNAPGLRGIITSRTLCAGNLDDSGPCTGDSGSGLMIQRNNRWFLRGVVSLGSKNGDRCNLQIYVLYCDLAKHKTWIQDNVIY